MKVLGLKLHAVRYAAVCVFIALVGCANIGGKPSPTDDVRDLEQAHGGDDRLRKFFDANSEKEIQSELAKFGIGYQVHGLAVAKSKGDQAEAAALIECVKYFPAGDRGKWHNFNGEYYYIDRSGRPAKAYADLPPVRTEARQTPCQTSIGRWGDAEDPANDYDGGHLIGSQLGGWGGRANIVPQNAHFNRGNWAQLENTMADCYRLPVAAMRYSIGVSYLDAAALIPAYFTMTITSQNDESKIVLKFTNSQGGGNSGEAERTRGVEFLRSRGCTTDKR